MLLMLAMFNPDTSCESIRSCMHAAPADTNSGLTSVRHSKVCPSILMKRWIDEVSQCSQSISKKSHIRKTADRVVA